MEKEKEEEGGTDEDGGKGKKNGRDYPTPSLKILHQLISLIHSAAIGRPLGRRLFQPISNE